MMRLTTQCLALRKGWAEICWGACLQDKERPGKAEDVVRLYDALMAFAADLGDLAADLGGAAGELLIDEAAAQVAYPFHKP